MPAFTEPELVGLTPPFYRALVDLRVTNVQLNVAGPFYALVLPTAFDKLGSIVQFFVFICSFQDLFVSNPWL